MEQSSPLTVVPYLGLDRPLRRGRRRQVGNTAKADLSSPHRSASKIKNACHQCRVKKTRCSGHKPCYRCVHRQQTCTYMSPMWPTSSTSTVANERQRPGSPRVPCISPDFAIDPLGAEPNVAAGDGGDDVVASTDTSDAPLQQDQYGHVHWTSSVFAFLNIAKQKLTSLPSMSIDFCDYPLSSSRALPRVLPPKAVADELVKNYFDFGLSTSRFVHEPTFRLTYKLMYSVGSGEGLQPDSLVLIYMIMALGSHYSRYDSVWCGYSASVQFYEMADQQLATLPSRITLTSVQARLLAVHYLLNHSRMHEAWSLFGTVVRHAQALGLHYRARKVPHNCIVHDIFGRPCAIHDDDVDQEECVLSNDEDISVSACRPAQPNTLCSAAAPVHYARLAHILGKILRQFYSLTAKRQTLSYFYDMAITFEAALSTWQSTLPKYLNFALLPTSALSVTLHRQVSTLKLTYAYANILLYRPFMLHSIEMVDSVKQAEFGKWVKRCHDESIAAANMIVSECQSLQEHGLFSKAFWMVNYAQFTAIGTLYMYYRLWPHAGRVWKVAEEARSQFTVGVEGDQIGQRYIEILSEFRRITSNHHEQPDIPDIPESMGNNQRFDILGHSPDVPLW
ncbi:hypothetical protein BDV38DRAFT_293877 [Aspergillus pseudotamarii]|uniref:Zn(2)-C6 fungal-type domain-containing protein n=1 Tax=Aspergillus pseudotamarii TaxID=132259 RepID=A0A5N6SP45_ASPPS|nr:uncharacterized protein BDV38DRAFT_293877 [Aspergillus pseudotamarii]KAE8136458.1 hypothetical protein BDV38DRAFT_293877 [Aspergillus pseudotamarii]